MKIGSFKADGFRGQPSTLEARKVAFAHRLSCISWRLETNDIIWRSSGCCCDVFSGTGQQKLAVDTVVGI